MSLKELVEHYLQHELPRLAFSTFRGLQELSEVDRSEVGQP